MQGGKKQNEASQLLFPMIFQLNWIETIVPFLAALRICCQNAPGKVYKLKSWFQEKKEETIVLVC